VRKYNVSVADNDPAAEPFQVFIPAGTLAQPRYLTFGKTDPATLAYDRDDDHKGHGHDGHDHFLLSIDGRSTTVDSGLERDRDAGRHGAATATDAAPRGQGASGGAAATLVRSVRSAAVEALLADDDFLADLADPIGRRG
jgi:hypothetical protein